MKTLLMGRGFPADPSFYDRGAAIFLFYNTMLRTPGSHSRKGTLPAKLARPLNFSRHSEKAKPASRRASVGMEAEL